MTEDYDVVIDTLEKQIDVLWKITQKNMTSEYLGMSIMDDIRLEQIDELKQAQKLWLEHKEARG